MKSNALVQSVVVGGVLWLALGTASLAQAPKKSSGEVRVGGQSVSGDEASARLQEFEEISDGLYLGASFRWSGKSKHYFTFHAADLGRQDQSASLLWGLRDHWKLQLSWDENPRWFSETALSPYTQAAPGLFTLPLSMRTDLQSGGSLLTHQPLNRPVDLSYARETAKVRFTHMAVKHWTFRLGYQNETRRGSHPLSFASYFSTGANSAQIAAPIHYRTQDATAAAEYANGRWFLSGEMTVNRFNNGMDALLLDNPLRYQDAVGAFGTNRSAATWRASVPPDNQAWSVNFGGGVALPNHNYLAADLSWGGMTSSTTLLPYTTNSAILALPGFTAALPTDHFDGRIRTFLATVKLNGDCSKWFGYSLSFRRYDMDNGSPRVVVPNYVAGDTLVAPARGTLAAGWEKTTWEADVHSAPLEGLRLALLYRHDRMARPYRETEATTERTWKARLDWTLASWATFRGAYTDLSRSEGAENHALEALLYPAGEPVLNGEPSDTRKFDLARRASKEYNLLLAITPTETFTCSVSAQGSRDKYPGTVLGRTGASYHNYGAEFSYNTLSGHFGVYGSYLRERYAYDMASRYRPVSSGNVAGDDPRNNWWDRTRDAIDAYTLGVVVTPLHERLDITSDLSCSKGQSASLITYASSNLWNWNGAGTAVNTPIALPAPSYPEVSNRLLIWKTQFNWHINDHFSASLAYWLQKYDRVDWATQALQTYMASSDPAANTSVYLGARATPYDADIVRVTVSYKF